MIRIPRPAGGCVLWISVPSGYDDRPGAFMTETQEAVLRFIASHIEDEGYPPTYKEIADHFMWRSIRTAQVHVRALVDSGNIAKPHGKRRAIRILELP